MHPALMAFVRSEVTAEKRLKVKAWAVGAAANDAMSFSVSEVRCADADCPDAETIILVMAEGQATRCARIALPLAAVTRAHVETAMADVLTSDRSNRLEEKKS